MMNNSQPTSDPVLNGVLADLVREMRAILGDKLLGVYLTGSHSTGEGDAASDVDFLAVIRDDLSDAEVAALTAMHAVLCDRSEFWAQHLEGSYFPQALMPAAYANRETLWYVDNGSRVLERSMHDNTLVVRWMLYEHAVALYGVEAKRMFLPIPADDLRAEVRDVMRWWGAQLLANPQMMNNGWYQPFAALSYARMLQTQATGGVYSKPQAVRWAQAHLPTRWAELVQRAAQRRQMQYQTWQDPADPRDLAETAAFIQYVLEQI